MKQSASQNAAESNRSAPAPEIAIERVVGQRIHAFSNMIMGNYFRRTEQPVGISLPEWRVLRSALLEPGASQSEVAAVEGMNIMNVSRAVAGLRRKGLLDVEADPDDRRRTRLNPTETGRALGVDIGERERSIYEHVFAVLSQAELETLNKMLERVNSGLRIGDIPDPPEVSADWRAIIEANVAAHQSDDGSTT